MKTQKRIFNLVTALVLGLTTSMANAVLIEVSQESAAGSNNFDSNILGFIDSFNTGLTAAGFYQYNSPNASSYNGELNGGPNPVSSTSQVFVVEASDGLTLMMVHDNPNDGSGGAAQTRWNLTGDTAAQVLTDDPAEPLTVSAGGTQFDSQMNWIDCCTDGYALGSLDSSWALFGQFVTAPTGITQWQAVSSDFSGTSLTLEAGRRVRLQLVTVPEPATIAILGLGLAAIGYRRKSAA